MAGERPPDRERPDSKPSDKRAGRNQRDEYYGADNTPPPPRRRTNEPGEKAPPSTWRPNADSSGSPRAPRSNQPPAPLPRNGANNPPDNGRARPSNPPPAQNGSQRNGSGARPSGQPPLPGRERGYRPLPPSNPGAKPPGNYPSAAPQFKPGEEDGRALARGARPAGQNPRQYAPARRHKGGVARSVALYGGITILVIGVIGLLFVVTRVGSFINGISVPRVDQNGAQVSSSGGTGGRINILLLGLDLRPNDKENGTRSDTMILVSVDQNTKTASMLSMPRDLWVEIPGHGTNRINAAYFFGEQDKPGTGGPPLAKATVSKLLGVSVDYFVQVDFNGFRQIVDAIGGITIDVKKPLIDNEYPTEDFGVKRIYVPAGVQHMDGQTALEYARSRHGDSDLGRNQRQQAVLLAIREQGINLGAVTNNELQSALAGAIKTDLQGGDILGLVQTGIGMNKDNIRSFTVDANLTKQANIDGNDVLLPDKEGIRGLVRQMLNTPNTPVKETANISVLNGTFTQGRASRTQQFLEGKGYAIGNVQQASDAGNYPNTIIRVYNGKQKTANELAGLLSIPADKVQVKGNGPPGIDIEIVCGEDLKLPQ